MASSNINRNFLDIPLPALLVSGGIHLLIPLVLLILQLLNLWESPFHTTEKTKKAVYQNFIQVDVVALPDEVEPEPFDPLASVAKENAAPPPPLEKPMEMATKKEPPKKVEKKKPDLKKAKADALEALQKEMAKKKALTELAKNQAEKKTRQVVKGNITSQGTAATGMLGDAKDRYTDIVHQAIRKHFSVFAWNKKKNLVSIVKIEVLENGRVGNIKSIRSSGNPSYEAAVRQAIWEASKRKLPLPLDRSLLGGGIILEFRTEEAS